MIFSGKQVATIYHSANPPYYFQNPIVLRLAKNGAINIATTQKIVLPNLECTVQAISQTVPEIYLPAQPQSTQIIVPCESHCCRPLNWFIRSAQNALEKQASRSINFRNIDPSLPSK